MEVIMAERKKVNIDAEAIAENTLATDNIAETTNNATKGNRITVRLPRLPGQNAIQEEFFSVNGKNYIIKRGETVEVPEEVAEVIENAEKAEEYALQYVEKLVQSEADKKKKLGI
jgi:hypothetical protein